MREAWNHFLSDVKDARAQLGNPDVVWYRGHADGAWTLVPTLFRVLTSVDGVEVERRVFLEFKRIASRLFDKRSNDWEVLFDMQHYWIPTRLLDWSEVLGIAVAFILHSTYGRAGDSSVYILNPVALNRLSGIPEIKNLPDDATFSYRSVYWDKKPFAAQHPIAVIPPLQTERVFAQRGAFTVHGEDARPLEDQCPMVVKKVILKEEAKEAAREFIEHANLDEYSIYPDIVGMSRHLRKKVFGF